MRYLHVPLAARKNAFCTVLNPQGQKSSIQHHHCQHVTDRMRAEPPAALATGTPAGLGDSVQEPFMSNPIQVRANNSCDGSSASTKQIRQCHPRP